MLRYKRIIKFPFFYFLLFLFSGCKLQKDLRGVYLSERNGMNTHELHIYQDSSFYYSLKGSLVDSFTEGFWEIDSMGFLVLKSHENLKSRVVKSEEFEVDRTGRFFKIVDSGGLPLPFSSLTPLQDTAFHAVANEAGEIYMDDNDIKDIGIYFLAEKYEYNIKSHDADSIIIFVQLHNSEFFYLENERFRFRNRNLVGDTSVLVFSRRSRSKGKH